MPVAIETRRYQPQFEVSDKTSLMRERYGEKAGEKQSYLRKKDRKIVGAEGFNLEYDSPPTRNELRRDIVSYLGEYRLRVQSYSYDLVYGRDKDKRGPITLRDQDRGDAMGYMTKRVIEERKRRGNPTHREEAEDKGIASLNDTLRYSQTGDTVVWASPPGPKEQGYGEYGFLYVGKVTKQSNGEARLSMSAIRIENPTIEQYNKAMTALTGEKVANKDAEAFLAAPTVVKKDISQRNVDKVLQENFEFKRDGKEKEVFAKLIKQMDPLIEEFLDVMENGSNNEKVKNFHKLENYALKLKEEYDSGEKVVYRGKVRLVDLDGKYDEKPPEVGGSCGRSGGGSMSNGLISAGVGGEEGSGEKHILKCRCPFCNVDVAAVIANGKITCPSCKGSAEYKC